ncbi:MAG: indole-3-glycerol phosphate synthase TrpC [Candidatus Omnitrophica bacterium]|nr:indole-3-glycerol phosphate synthase TrpC [Candidatus Omnitrophota bacterium]MBI3020691.1 indole-3-glycerol phosphate synthase TrpC [Candidatus Omnitrophota bacterium]
MLDEIVFTKQRELAEAKQRLPFEELKDRLAAHVTERDFRAAISVPGKLSLIAELKRKSPSRGMLRERFDPVSLAQMLAQAGAAALSVLTDEHYFGGHLDFLRDAQQFTDVPVLRKDFIVDPYQVYEAALFGADAVLLIVRILSEDALVACLQAADTVGVEPFVEVHSEADLKSALGVGARVLGINHRDLRTFAMDPHLTERLIPTIPAGKIIVAESGIQCAEDVTRMQRLGVHALLIGEALMTAPDPAAKVRELFAGTW